MRILRWAEDLSWDVTYAVRNVRKAPEFALIALLSIALSVGASAVVFTAVKAVLIEPLPYAQPQELVQIATDFAHATRSEGDWVFWNDVQEISRRTRTLQSLGAYGNAVFDLAGDGASPPEALYGLRISSSLFPTLGVAPLLGRNILPEEDRPGHAKVIILSHGLWSRRFRADPKIVGQSVSVNGHNCLVIGVMAPGFNFPLRRQATRTPVPYVEFWAPLQIDPAARPEGALGMVARLRPGVTLSQAQADLSSISSALAREFPASNRDRSHRLDLLRDRTLRSAGTALWLLMAATALFLLIGCVNVANLLLSRGFARRHEFTVRMALGASGSRMIRQLLAESCFLALLGGLGGFALTAAAWQVLPALVPVSIPRLLSARADWTILGFALAVALATGLLFGMAPAIRAGAWRPAPGTRELAVRGAAGARDRTRAWLVTGEVAITVMLVVVGGQVLTSFLRLVRTDPGFAADQVFAAVVLPAPERYRTPEERAVIYERFLNAARGIPGVESAGTVDALPFSGENHGGFISTHPTAPFDARNQAVAEVDVVGGEYLQAMGVRLIEGRWFRADEMEPENESAIVDEAVARRFWPHTSPLGRRLCVHCTPERPGNWKRVVGVVSSMRHASLEGTAHQNVYLASGGMQAAAFLVLRSARPAGELDRALRAAIAAVDPQQPVLISASLRSFVSDSVADRRFIASILGVTGCLALLLAAAGVYGVTAYITSRRTQEIGIRMALGATTGSVHRLLVRETVITAGIGLAAGLGSAVAALRVLSGSLQGVEAAEPALIAAAAALVLCVAALASWIPARRAVRLDPMLALREE